MANTEVYPSARDDVPAAVRRATGDWTNALTNECNSDRTSLESVGHALRASGRSALRKVVVNVRPDSIVLAGCVPRYYDKQLAQALVLQGAANRQVVNEIEVVCCR